LAAQGDIGPVLGDQRFETEATTPRAPAAMSSIVNLPRNALSLTASSLLLPKCPSRPDSSAPCRTQPVR